MKNKKIIYILLIIVLVIVSIVASKFIRNKKQERLNLFDNLAFA